MRFEEEERLFLSLRFLIWWNQRPGWQSHIESPISLLYVTWLWSFNFGSREELLNSFLLAGLLELCVSFTWFFHVNIQQFWGCITNNPEVPQRRASPGGKWLTQQTLSGPMSVPGGLKLWNLIPKAKFCKGSFSSSLSQEKPSVLCVSGPICWLQMRKPARQQGIRFFTDE